MRNDDDDDDERARNKRAMVVLEESEVPTGAQEAIQNLCRQFRECLLSSMDNNDRSNTNDNANDDDNDNDNENDNDYRHKLAQFLRYEHLIAAQPNLHSGRALLPVHLDDPRKDGFGVIIITIGMEGSGTILLRDAKGLKHGVAMRLEAGESYMLSDRARDACAHGVLADDGYTDNTSNANANATSTRIPCSERESLNLRFGLHDFVFPYSSNGGGSNGNGNDGSSNPLVSLPVIPASMVLRHWDEE